MKIEHVAIDVADPPAMAQWWCDHLGLTVVRKLSVGPRTHFLADSSGQMLLEVYCNPPDRVPDYRRQDPLILHIAFLSGDLRKDCDRLVAAGAVVVDDIVTTPAGDQVAMLRDPWGLAFQFVQRQQPMLK